MDIGSCKSANSRINIVKKKNNFRIIVLIIEMGIFSYYVFEEFKCNSCSTSFKWQKRQIRRFSGVLGIVCLPVSIRNR